MKALFLGDVAVGSEDILIDIEDIPLADNVVVNFEGSLKENAYSAKKEKRSFYNSRAVFNLLESLRVTHVNVLNNHSLDLGLDTFKFSLKSLIKRNYKVLSYQNFLVNEVGANLGVISIGSVLIGTPERWSRLEDRDLFVKLQKSIEKSGFNRVVLYIHAGFEFENHPEPWLRNILVKIAQLPEVSLILCMHSHVVKGFDVVDGTFIFYGLGNFYIENHHYFQGKLVYEEFCDIGLAIRYSQSSLEVFKTIKSESSVKFERIDIESELVDYGRISDYKQFYSMHRRSYRLMLLPPSELKGFKGTLYVRFIQVRAFLIKSLIPVKDNVIFRLLKYR